MEYLQLVITLMTLNFLRTGQVLEAPAGTSSKSISNSIQEPLATKMKLKKSDLNLNSYNVPKLFLSLLNAITQLLYQQKLETGSKN